MPTAVVTLHVTVLDNHWGFSQFLHLRVLDITFLYWTDPMSTKDIQRGFHNILASLRSPVLEHVCLLLRFPSSMPLFRRDIDAATVADPAQYTDLHAILARPIFSSLHRVTIVLHNDDEESISMEDLVLEPLDFLRALFAPWCVRGIVSLACAIHDNVDKRLNAVMDEGKGLRSIKWSGWNFDREKLFADLGLQQHWPRL